MPGIDAKTFSDAVWNGDIAAVRQMISAGADVNASDGEQSSPLHLAIEQVNLEIVRRLIAAGADVNRDAGWGCSPLVHAIDAESDSALQTHGIPGRMTAHLTEVLLAAGAAVNDDAFRMARDYGNRRALELLEGHSRLGQTPGRPGAI